MQDNKGQYNQWYLGCCQRLEHNVKVRQWRASNKESPSSLVKKKRAEDLNKTSIKIALGSFQSHGR